MSDLRKDIEHAINCASAENGSNTPDFILAEYLTDCLTAFDKATRARERWLGAPEAETAQEGLELPPTHVAPDTADGFD